MKNLLMVLFFVMMIVSCSKGGDDRIAEQEDIKARQQVDAENENRRELSLGPESDLDEIKFFMKAVEGEFKGSIEISGIPLDVYAEIIPSKEIKFYTRTRTLDEIQADRDELTLTIKVLVENPNVMNSGSTCIFEEHRPDTKRGLMKLIKEGCKNTFSFSFYDEINPSDITSNNQSYVDDLKGSLSTGVSSTKYKFTLKRLK